MTELIYTGLPPDFEDTEEWEPIPEDHDKIMAEIAAKESKNWNDMFEELTNGAITDDERDIFD